MHQDRRGYWYRSSRSGGRVQREYMGRGKVAMLGARLEELNAQERKEERQLERERLAGDTAQARAIDAPIEEISADVERLLRQVLEACGYHLHARSQWRKRRIQAMSEPTPVTTRRNRTKAMPSTAIQKKAAAASEVDTALLGKQARTDPEAAKQYVDRMVEAGLLEKLAGHVGMAYQAESSLLNSLSATDELTKETWRRHMEHIRQQLAGDNATPLEQMLIERIALCWLHVHIIEMTVAQRHATMTLLVAEYQQKRLDKAHKRHLQAIKALAQVRKMQLPTPVPQVQINVASNVAERQVVAGTNGQALISPASRVCK